jgi:hypothetical protein
VTVARTSVLLALSACAAAPPPVAPPPPPVAVVAAPPPEVVAPAPPPPPTLAELELTAHRTLFDALRAHDATALAALYAPDASVDLGFVDAHGGAAVAALASTLWAAFPDSKVQWRTFLPSGATVAVELAWTGTYTGALAEHAPTKRVLGTRALLIERFAPSGLIASQRLYLDADALATDLATRVGKLHSFAGLPTAQTTVLDHAPPRPDDDAAMRRLTAALAAGSLKEIASLGQEESAWVDETKRHTTSGKGAVGAWTYFVAHAFPGKVPESFSTGDYVVNEWKGAAEVIAFDKGHLVEVRTYRSTAPKPEKH